MVATHGTQHGQEWNLAPCLAALFEEADRRKPTRSHAWDGSIGNAEHQARTSDHNPEDGWVTAGDVDDDNDSAEVDVDGLIAHLVHECDHRVDYLIRNGQIWRSYNRPKTATRPFLKAWTPEPYTGPNPHDHHGHISVKNTPEARDDTGPWWPAEEDDMTPEQAKKLDEIHAALVSKDATHPSPLKQVLDGVRRIVAKTGA